MRHRKCGGLIFNSAFGNIDTSRDGVMVSASCLKRSKIGASKAEQPPTLLSEFGLLSSEADDLKYAPAGAQLRDDQHTERKMNRPHNPQGRRDRFSSQSRERGSPRAAITQHACNAIIGDLRANCLPG